MNARKVVLFLVLTILGVVASSRLASLNSERSKDRDARRLSDIAQIQSALASYYKDHKMYPPSADGSKVNDIQASLVPSYLPSVPQDPFLRNGNPAYGYRYCAANTTGQDYSLLVYFENAPLSYHDKGCSLTTGADDCSFVSFPRCD